MEPDKRTCYVCNIEKPITAYPISSNPPYPRGLKCSACAAKATRRRLRLEMLEAYGFKCQCPGCSESDIRFLTFDHVEGQSWEGGHRNRPSFVPLVQARREGWPKDKYQLLCYNCNCAKGRNGICPHRTEITAEMALENLRKEAEYYAPFKGGWPKGVPRGPQTEEQKAKMSEILKGKPKSGETRQNMKDGWKDRRANRLGPGTISNGKMKEALGMNQEQLNELLKQLLKS